MKSKSVITGHDYGADLFSAIRELGDHMDIQFAVVSQNKTDRNENRGGISVENPKSHSYSHCEYDGIGAFSSFLKSVGITPGSIPTCREPSCPPDWKRYFQIVKILIQGTLRDRRDGTGWKNYKSESGIYPDSPDHFRHWFLLNPAETRRVHEKAREADVSTNSYLLNRIHNHFASSMISDAGKICRWMVAVNLRGPVALDRPEGNHSSSIGIYVHSDDPPQKTHRRVKKAFTSKDHWANWNFMTISRTIGKRKLVEGMKKNAEKGVRPYIGTFSNLGKWTLPDFQETGMLFSPPPGPNTPFSAGALEVNGSLGLAFQCHPSLKLTEETLDSIISALQHDLMQS